MPEPNTATRATNAPHVQRKVPRYYHPGAGTTRPTDYIASPLPGFQSTLPLGATRFTFSVRTSPYLTLAYLAGTVQTRYLTLHIYRHFSSKVPQVKRCSAAGRCSETSAYPDNHQLIKGLTVWLCPNLDPTADHRPPTNTKALQPPGDYQFALLPSTANPPSFLNLRSRYWTSIIAVTGEIQNSSAPRTPVVD